MRFFLAAFTIAILFSSCQIFGGKKVSGNGNIVTRDINVGNFHSLDVSGAITVHVRQNATPSVRVETDENLLEYLEIKVDGNTLQVQTRDGFNLHPSKELIVYVSSSRLNEIDLSGASHIIGDGLITGDELSLHASGASEITMQLDVSKFTSELSGASTMKLTGSADRFSTDASGASKILCLDLRTQEATLDLSGASEAAVTAEKELNIDASGASNVEYRGNANINQKSSGASNVKKLS